MWMITSSNSNSAQSWLGRKNPKKWSKTAKKNMVNAERYPMGSMLSPDGGWMFLPIEDAGWTVSKWWKHYVLIKHSINEVVGHFGSRKELNSTSFQTTLSGRKFQTVASQPASKRGKIKRSSTNCRPRKLQNSFLYSSQNSIFYRNKCFQWKMNQLKNKST